MMSAITHNPDQWRYQDASKPVGCEVSEAGMDPFRVVPVDPFEDRSSGFGSGGEHSVLEAFAFEAFPERLGYCVIEAHPGTAY
jgi:hypothetical protein